MLQSVMRTLVPILYALLIRFGLGDIGVDDATVQAVATLAATGLVYVVLRVAERYRREIGVLLGWIGAPKYDDTAVKGEVVSSRAELDDALAALRDDLGSVVEDKVTAALTKATAPKTTGRKATVKASTKSV